MKNEHITIATGLTIVTILVGAIVFYFSDANANESEHSEISAKLNLLCNDYGNTINRIDQNLQVMGQALKVPIQVGKADPNPCK